MTKRSEARYTYGDTRLAADRLELVGEAFAPTTRSFLRRAAPMRPELALDLGCGPGHTTRLLHETVDSRQTVGLDRSTAFIEAATKGAPPGVSFMRHDVTVTPFPSPPAELAFCRLLLAHLADPEAVVAAWSTQLADGGMLLLDELEAIHAPDPAVRAYLDEVAIPVVASQGARLLAGPLLHAMPDPPLLERVTDEIATLEPPAEHSARIFRMNLAVLVEQGDVAPRPDLAAALGRITGAGRSAPTEWQLRQIVLRRAV